MPSNIPEPTPPGRAYDIVTVSEQDMIKAIDEPRFYAVAAADAEYHPAEAVIGVSIGGEHRAYSVVYLESHQIVNDSLGGRAIAVTWGPLAYAAAVYDRETAGRKLTFGVSGQLVLNATVMYDRQTGSSWSQITGEAVDGPLAGEQLAHLSSQLTKWSDWKTRHPDTLALVKGSRIQIGPYATYYRSSRVGALGWAQKDDRLGARDLVLGITAGYSAAAYPYRAMRQRPVINDQIGSEPALVVFQAATSTGVAFSRRLADGRVLTFKAQENLLLADAETGSAWSALDGRATAGPLAGTQLMPLSSMMIFWFAWVDWHPDTRVFELS